MAYQEFHFWYLLFMVLNLPEVGSDIKDLYNL